MHILLTWLLVFGLGASAALPAQSAAAAPREITLEISRSQNSYQMGSIAQELTKVLEGILHMPVRVMVAEDYSSAVKNLVSHRVDFAYLPAVSYVHAAKNGKVRILVKIKRYGRSSFVSRFFVLKAGGIKRLSELKGKKIAFVDRMSSAGYVYPMMLLLRNKLLAKGEPKSFFGEVRFAGSHEAALRALLKGEVDAATTFDAAPRQYFKKDMDRLTYIAETLPIVEGGICAHDGVSAELAEKVKAAFLSINARTYPQLMKYLFLADMEGFLPVEDSEYDPVRDVVSLLEVP